MMKKLMHILFLSCLKATELIEKKISFKLSRKEKIQIKAHKMMCSACTNYEKHSLLIEKGLEKSMHPDFSQEDLELLKQGINKKLEGLK